MNNADSQLTGIQEELSRPDVKPSLRVLVVNDYQDNVESMAMLLRLYGHEVMTAIDGAAALEAALGQRPDVVLLDISMPGIDSFEFARYVRELYHNDVFIVALTAYGSAENLRRYELADFDRHLVKPADPAEVEQLVRGLAVSL